MKNVVHLSTLTEGLIPRALELEALIKKAQGELKAIKEQVADLAEFEHGKKTGYLIQGAYTAKVQLRENLRWDQKKLDSARLLMGNEAFFKIFKPDFKPISKKKLDGFLEYGEIPLVMRIKAALTQSAGSPAVSFECLEEE